MYRFVLSRRWLAGLAFALVAATACVLLAQWQWHRRDQRLAANHLITSNYDLGPVPVADLVSTRPGSLDPQRTWTPVSTRGRYLSATTVLVRNRPSDAGPGYLVLVPFRDDVSGLVLLIDRGWVPAGETGAEPTQVPAPPAGTVDVVSRLRPPEPASSRGAPAGQTQSITPTALLGQLSANGIAAGSVVTAAYGELAVEEPTPPKTPVAPPKPDLDEGPHLSYALQWIVFAIVFVAAWVTLVRREAEDRDQGPARPARPRHSGVTDEDIEDAQVARLVPELDQGSRPGTAP